MSYTYDGNQLDDVLETGHHYGGFADKTNTQTGDYEYDANGNMTIDRNKNITNILYNHLNLPKICSPPHALQTVFLLNRVSDIAMYPYAGGGPS